MSRNYSSCSRRFQTAGFTRVARGGHPNPASPCLVPHTSSSPRATSGARSPGGAARRSSGRRAAGSWRCRGLEAGQELALREAVLVSMRKGLFEVVMKNNGKKQDAGAAERSHRSFETVIVSV